MKWRAVLLLTFVAAFAASADLAQENAGQAGAVLRVQTRLVEISVVAQDSRGRAVTGLSRDDFTLNDDGKPTPIDVFSPRHPSVPWRRPSRRTLFPTKSAASPSSPWFCSTA
ncbi:MAG: hypothetical protein ACRD3D_05990 [Terriglobia bacterium]